ncbi:unnamed protein product, partial [Peniophora sp. CBMAI 1063]
MLLEKVAPNFLSDQELDLVALVVSQHQRAFAFEYAEKGTFSREYFPEYEIATIEHTPWQQAPIRVPKALENAVRTEILDQEANGRFEMTTSSYRSAIFAVEKKNKGVRLVLDLQRLNGVTIRDAGLPPRMDDFAESFVGYAIYAVLDLYSGFDAVPLAARSRPMTAFHSIIGPRQQTTLPQGATNSPTAFQQRMDHTLIRMSAADKARPFFDDCGVKGPRTTYDNEPLADNPNIRRFVFEFCETLAEFLATLILAGVTASGMKSTLATPLLDIVGTLVSLSGWQLHHGIVNKVLKWVEPADRSELRGFLGTTGCGRRWIRNYSLVAKPLTILLRGSEADFFFGDEARAAMLKLKNLVTRAPVLVRIDYELAATHSRLVHSSEHGLIIVAVDASLYGAGWVLYQVLVKPPLETVTTTTTESPSKPPRERIERHPAIFGSRTFNAVEARYSQPKCELYGVFRAVKDLRHRIYGVFFMLEVDAKSLIEMLRRPDLPGASETRWISFIQTFDFDVRHVPASAHEAQDGLSRRRTAPDDSSESDGDQDGFIDHVLDALYGRHDSDWSISSAVQADRYPSVQASYQCVVPPPLFCSPLPRQIIPASLFQPLFASFVARGRAAAITSPSRLAMDPDRLRPHEIIPRNGLPTPGDARIERIDDFDFSPGTLFTYTLSRATDDRLYKSELKFTRKVNNGPSADPPRCPDHHCGPSVSGCGDISAVFNVRHAAIEWAPDYSYYSTDDYRSSAFQPEQEDPLDEELPHLYTLYMDLDERNDVLGAPPGFFSSTQAYDHPFYDVMRARGEEPALFESCPALPMPVLLDPVFENRGANTRGFISCIGHKFGVKDEDTPEM